ncbi:transmembrane anchor protein [Luteimonas terricola]|uniref:Transmembrane anchor protein n=1 Tax=Luteimonas terricola TaxID=645597 RepID=A0ABQ2EGQ6_9GAMM|nr:transmembrane anchor protein [Luteimonas terricola]GGK06259.1 hypothetical protein GCM10011394_14270 [Luteimonas terricola]
MYNSKPTNSDLPSSSRLLKSTIIAAAVAVLFLVTIVLPAEYGIDPTGIGRALGLAEMGEIKTQLAEERDADAILDAASADAAIIQPPQPAQALDVAGAAGAAGSASAAAVEPVPEAKSAWRDEMRVELSTGQGAEVKLAMNAGEQATFSWMVEGGVVNFDTHGDGGGRSTSYEKGRGVPADEGVLEAAFDGNHGWFWRNRGSAPVTVIIRTGGAYSAMKRVI